jgi:hypothetical protein
MRICFTFANRKSKSRAAISWHVALRHIDKVGSARSIIDIEKTWIILGCLEADPSTARKHFFLKKEAKTFAHLAYAVGQRERLIIKSFLVLFLKKELLPFFFQPHLWS